MEGREGGTGTGTGTGTQKVQESRVNGGYPVQCQERTSDDGRKGKEREKEEEAEERSEQPQHQQHTTQQRERIALSLCLSFLPPPFDEDNNNFGCTSGWRHSRRRG